MATQDRRRIEEGINGQRCIADRRSHGAQSEQCPRATHFFDRCAGRHRRRRDRADRRVVDRRGVPCRARSVGRSGCGHRPARRRERRNGQQSHAGADSPDCRCARRETRRRRRDRRAGAVRSRRCAAQDHGHRCQRSVARRGPQFEQAAPGLPHHRRPCVHTWQVRGHRGSRRRQAIRGPHGRQPVALGHDRVDGDRHFRRPRQRGRIGDLDRRFGPARRVQPRLFISVDAREADERRCDAIVQGCTDLGSAAQPESFLRETVLRRAVAVAHATREHAGYGHRGADGARRDLRRSEHDVLCRRIAHARDRDAARSGIRLWPCRDLGTR